MKVVIGFAARDMVNAGFALDMGSLCANKIDGVTIGVNTVVGTILPDQRNTLANHALSVGADYLLWVDTDMRFPRDGLARLLAHKLPIVAASYTTRRIPITPVAKNYIPEADEWRDVPTTELNTGLEEVSGVGMGFMLTATEVFKKLPAPWFSFPWDPKAGKHHGEDIRFCLNAADAGFPTKIDHDLTKQVRHTGSLDFCYQHLGVNE